MIWWATYRLAFSDFPAADLLCQFALGLPRPAVFLGAICTTGLPFDCFGRTIFTQAEFLAALPILGGANAPEVQLLILSAGLIARLYQEIGPLKVERVFWSERFGP